MKFNQKSRYPKKKTSESMNVGFYQFIKKYIQYLINIFHGKIMIISDILTEFQQCNF